MNFEDVGRVWREDPGEYRRRNIEDLSSVMGRSEGLLDGLYRRGKVTGVLTGLIAVPTFGWSALNAPRPELVVPGVVMLVAWLAIISFQWKRLRRPSTDASLPVREAVRAEVERLRFLERFWGKVSWSLALFVVGEVLVFEGLRPAGTEGDAISLLFYGGMLVILTVMIFRNPVYARHKVRPLREDLESWLEGLSAWERSHELPAD